MVGGGIAPLDDDLLRPKRYVLAELGDYPTLAHVDFLAQEQSLFDYDSFLHDWNNHRVTVISDFRGRVDLTVDSDSLDFDFHRFERLLDHLSALARYCANADTVTFHASFADFEFFFDDRNAYIFNLVFRYVGHDTGPIRTGRAKQELSAPPRRLE
jgi:hypothetical protein